MNKTVILNFANKVGRYGLMQERLKKSLVAVGYTGDIMFFNHEEEISLDPPCPYHASEDLALHAAGKVVPYGFKAYAIKKAIDAGYENIIWMDAAVYATKPIDDFISMIEKWGYVFFDNIGFSIGDYTSDACLNTFGMTRTEAFNKKMIMACVMGINTKSKGAMLWFSHYYGAANDGVSYLGSWHNSNGEVSSDMRVKGHRHDQSVASIIISALDLTILNAQQTFFAYDTHKGILPIADSVCLWSNGI